MTYARLAPLVLVALLAASCSDSDKSSSATTNATTTSSAVTPPRLPPAASPGRLTMGKRNLYPLLTGSLANYVSKPVRATDATIVQLAGLDTFWAGHGGKRVLVKIDLKGQRPPTLQQNQQVSFVGRFVKAPKTGSALGVKPKSGEPLLLKQGVYVVVPIDKLKLQ